jgi:hypothetical protein
VIVCSWCFILYTQKKYTKNEQYGLFKSKTQYTQVTGYTNRTMRADPKGLHLLHLTASLERNEQMQEHLHAGADVQHGLSRNMPNEN